MKIFKTISTRNLFLNTLLALFTTLTLLSCSKDMADTAEFENAQTSAVVGSPEPRTTNGAVAGSFSKTIFVPCANGGAGENVVLSGEIHFVYQMTWTDHGFTMVYHDNLIGVTGVGAISGENFVASRGTQGNVMGPWYSHQWVRSMIRNIRLAGPNTKFSINYRLNLILKDDGQVLVDVVEETIDCDSN